MAGIEQNHNHELSTSKSTAATTFSKTSLFNRSMTIHASANRFARKPYVSSPLDRNVSASMVDRNVSMKKWYESAGTSLKGKVKQLKTLFETPKSVNYNSTSSLSSSNNQVEPEESPLPPSFHNHHTFARLRPAKSFSSDFKDSWSILDASNIRFPGTEDRVVLYFTSLRGIRRTFEDCFAVRMIFRGFKVFVDERDVSMDIAYRKELQGLLGEEEKNNVVSLPQVFIKGRYVGGVDLIRQLNETGELRKILQVLPVRERRFVCEVCGDVRFVPCSNCSGSRKVFDEDEEVMKRCLECNENGLLRCPECCL